MIIKALIFIGCLHLLTTQIYAEDKKAKDKPFQGYSYNFEYNDNNGGKYGHKIEVKNSNPLVKVSNPLPNNNAKYQQQYLKKSYPTSSSKLKQQKYQPVANVSNGKPTNQQSVISNPGQTYSQHQLAVLLAQNKNPYLPIDPKDLPSKYPQHSHTQTQTYPSSKHAQPAQSNYGYNQNQGTANYQAHYSSNPAVPHTINVQIPMYPNQLHQQQSSAIPATQSIDSKQTPAKHQYSSQYNQVSGSYQSSSQHSQQPQTLSNFYSPQTSVVQSQAISNPSISPVSAVSSAPPVQYSQQSYQPAQTNIPVNNYYYNQQTPVTSQPNYGGDVTQKNYQNIPQQTNNLPAYNPVNYNSAQYASSYNVPQTGTGLSTQPQVQQQPSYTYPTGSNLKDTYQQNGQYNSPANQYDYNQVPNTNSGSYPLTSGTGFSSDNGQKFDSTTGYNAATASANSDYPYYYPSSSEGRYPVSGEVNGYSGLNSYESKPFSESDYNPSTSAASDNYMYSAPQDYNSDPNYNYKK